MTWCVLQLKSLVNSILGSSCTRGMNREFLEILGILQQIRMPQPVCSPADFHKAHFTLTYCEFLLSESTTIVDYLKEKGLNTVNETVSYGLAHGLDYDPFAVPSSTWEDGYISLLHQMMGREKQDEDFTRLEYLWILGGLVLGQGGSEDGVRSLYRQLNCSSRTGIRVLVRDSAAHIEIPELPNDRPRFDEEGVEWPYH